MRPAFVAQQQGITLGVVAGVFSSLQYFYQAPVCVASMPGGDSLRDDGAFGVFTDVDHLGPGIGLLVIIGQSHGVELAHCIITPQNTAGIFPGDGRSGLHLCPGDSGAGLPAITAFGDKIVDATLPVLISGIPVLNRGVLDLCILQGNELHYCGMQLIFIAHRSRTSFQIAHIGAFIGNDQRALKLPRADGVDAKIGRKLHGTPHTFGDIDKGTIGKDSGIEAGKKIIRMRHYAAQVLLHKVGMFKNRL